MLNTHEDLKRIFEIDRISDKYIHYTPFENSDSIGFSIQREYPKNIRYKPPTTKSGASDTIAIIYVYLSKKTVATKETSDKAQINLAIKTYSQYLSNHKNYKFDESDCPTKESVKLSERSPKPISLDSTEEYFYDYNQGVLKDKTNTVISGEKILDIFFEQHCNTIHMIKGLKLQWQLSSQKFAIKVIEVFLPFLIWLLRATTGRVIDTKKESLAGIFEPYQKEHMRLLEGEKIEFFEYEVGSKNII